MATASGHTNLVKTNRKHLSLPESRRVDDDITDDVAADGTVGAGRAEAAAASKARKAAEAAALAAENDAMRERIANTGAASVNQLS